MRRRTPDLIKDFDSLLELLQQVFREACVKCFAGLRRSCGSGLGFLKPGFWIEAVGGEVLGEDVAYVLFRGAARRILVVREFEAVTPLSKARCITSLDFWKSSWWSKLSQEPREISGSSSPESPQRQCLVPKFQI